MDNTKEKNGSDSDVLFLRMGLNDNKAGMEGLDKEKINKIILEASKGSRFYENELKREKQVNQRIENMMQQKDQISSQQLKKAQLQVDKLAMDLDQSRDLRCTIVHIDMDAFYAAVEMRDNPELRDKPIAVGSMSMLSTSNYHARRFGVRAAMPGFIAKRLCPHLTIVPTNFDKYREVSKEVREILTEYDPNFMAMSLDEAYLNITKHLEERQNWPEDKRRYFFKAGNTAENDKSEGAGSRQPELCEDELSFSPVLFEDSPPLLQQQGQPTIHFQEVGEEQESPQVAQNSIIFGTSAEDVVREIRFRIEQKTTLTASAGIAPNMMLAKVCSDKNKPNGQYRILPTRQAVMDFIKDLPIRKVSGIGKVTEKMLKALGITTCTDLYQQRALLSLLFSESSWHNFLHISLGLGSTHLEKDGERKSMSIERTFSEISKAEEQYSLCQELCNDLAQDLQKELLKGKTVTLKLKNVNFEVRTRASTVSSGVSTGEEIYAMAKELLRTEIEADFPHPLRLRLMGVRISGFLLEDKRHQQRSIISFLQSESHVPTITEVAVEKTDQEGPKPQEMAPKESFFNKKRAERKQHFQELLKYETEPQQDLQTLQTTVISKRGTNEIPNSENSGEYQMFTCPICLKVQGSTCLETFNRHIDGCLSRTLMDSDSDIPQELMNSAPPEIRKTENMDDNLSPCEEVDFEILEKMTKGQLAEATSRAHVEMHSRWKHVESFSKEAGDQHGMEESAVTHSNSSNSKSCHPDSPPITSLSLGRQETLQPYLPSMIKDKNLVCPVCNMEQKTSDLSLFNRHVDVCLNKSLIQEMRKYKVSPDKNSNPGSSKTAGNLGQTQKVNATTRTKRYRPGVLTQHSSSKKTKPNNSKYTIDSFFK
ncbi:DNA polymerase kappa isoform X1 [Ornithorhynchus anatinus]|nr:DNA polymerase kappa isoform X1 [Ornithorhynchus anatinus]XP_028928566.1 DNA polymerase kappa isoform X1 [Ornithorhynchus anatinus]